MFDQKYRKLMQELRDNGKDVTVRGGQKTRELLNYEMKLDPMRVVTSFHQRNFKLDYAFAEWLWYCSMDKRVEKIGLLASMWDRLKDENGEVESNYGTYLLGIDYSLGMSQFRWCIEELRNDPSSRRAVMTINQPYHKVANQKDMPCTMFVQYVLRDDCLHSFVRMRSNDAVYGLNNDVFTWALFHQLMTWRLAQATNNDKLVDNMFLGKHTYTHSSESMHVYERHFDMMRNIATDWWLPIEQIRVELKKEFVLSDEDDLRHDNPFWDQHKYTKESLTEAVKQKMERTLNVCREKV